MSLSSVWSSTRKIICVARNYADHAAEMGAKVGRPFFFLKPSTSLLPEGQGNIQVPADVVAHHEVELGVVIGQGGRQIPQDTAMDHVMGYALTIDMTARNYQAAAKKQGRPWSMAKGLDTFCPVGPFIPAKAISDPGNLRIWLSVDDEMRQHDTTDLMLASVPALIHQVSRWTTLCTGDLILTGTPKGVGAVKPGQVIRAGLEGLDGTVLSKVEFGVSEIEALECLD